MIRVLITSKILQKKRKVIYEIFELSSGLVIDEEVYPLSLTSKKRDSTGVKTAE